MGIATHASFHLEKPTIGIAKSYLKIKNTEFIMPENTVGAYTDIVINNEVYGRVLRTRKDVKPVFVRELDRAGYCHGDNHELY